MIEETGRLKVLAKAATLVVMAAFALLALVSCVSDGETKSEASAAVQGGVQAIDKAPVPIMPPEPGKRGEQAVYDEADRRSEALKPMIDQQIASVVPGPYPEPKKKKKKKKKRKKKAPAAPRPVAVAPAPEPAPKKELDISYSSLVAAELPDLELVKKFTTENGLPSNIITSIYVDDNEAWVGTSGGGVARYIFAEDNWLVTSEVDGLLSDHITDVIKYQGKVYVGTKQGISIWDGVSWSHTTVEERVQLLNTKFRVNRKSLWVSARNMRGGLLEYNGKKWKNKSTIRTGVILNNVSDFDFNGKDIWIGTTSRGVFARIKKKWSVFTVADGISSNFVYTMAVNGNKCILGGCCGASVYDGSAWVIYDVPEGLPHATVNDIVWDGDLAWLGTKNGVALFDGEEFYNFYAEDGLLADNHVTSLFLQGDELWVGTTGGLSRLIKR